MRAVGILSSPNLRAALPYSIVVRNGTSKSIIAYTAFWTTTGEHGDPYSYSRTVGGMYDPGSQIAPNAEKIITIAMQPNEDLTGYVNRFEHSAVTIALDAVMFEDGSTAGPDYSESMAKSRQV